MRQSSPGSIIFSITYRRIVNKVNSSDDHRITFLWILRLLVWKRAILIQKFKIPSKYKWVDDESQKQIIILESKNLQSWNSATCAHTKPIENEREFSAQIRDGRLLKAFFQNWNRRHHKDQTWSEIFHFVNVTNENKNNIL